MKKMSCFQILGDTNQVLQLILAPDDQIYISGNILYGSPEIYTRQKQLMSVVNKWLGRSYALKKIKNEEDSLQYIGLKKVQGKILVLNTGMYGGMFVHKDKILAVNYQYTPNIHHEKFKEFILLPRKNQTDENCGFIQSDNNTYIQKQLGVGQKMMCKRESLLAFKSVVNVQVGVTAITLTGPGFVFLSSTDVSRSQVTVGRLVMGVVLLFMIEAFFAGLRLQI